MEHFPFSRKRFLSMPVARRHKWVALWLQRNYEDLLENRAVNAAGLDRFFGKYLEICAWLDQPEPSLRKPTSYRKWMEFTSERFHAHRRGSGKGLAEANFLPHVARGDRKYRGEWSPAIPYRVAMDNLRSAFNVGSIIRVVDAVGFESVLVSGNTPGTEHAQVRKTAMGCAGWVPGKRYKRLDLALNRVRAKGWPVIGVETVPDSLSYRSFPWPARGIVVLGNEEYGISEDVLKACDHFVHLPMLGNKNSINVANAFAVVAFHIAFLHGPKTVKSPKP